MRSDYFQRFDAQLTGGLRRLFDSSAFFLDGYQDHAITETAPGHSVTMSGSVPRPHGDHDELGGGQRRPRRRDHRERRSFRPSCVADPVPGNHAYRLVEGGEPGDAVSLGFAKGSRRDPPDRAEQGRRVLVDHVERHVQHEPLLSRHASALGAAVQRAKARASNTPARTGTCSCPRARIPSPTACRPRIAARTSPSRTRCPTTRSPRRDRPRRFPWMDDITLQFALAGVNALGLGASTEQHRRAGGLALDDRRDRPRLRAGLARDARPDPAPRPLARRVPRLAVQAARPARGCVIALTADHGMSPLPGDQVDDLPEPRREGRVDRARVAGVPRAARRGRRGLDCRGAGGRGRRGRGEARRVRARPRARRFGDREFREGRAACGRGAPRGSHHVAREGRHDERHHRPPLAAHVRARRARPPDDHAHAVQLLGARELPDARIAARQRCARAGAVLRRRA